MKKLSKLLVTTIGILVFGMSLLPSGSVLCLTDEGHVHFEQECNCASEKPPCCSEENHQNEANYSSNDCRDTVIHSDNFVILKERIAKITELPQNKVYWSFLSELQQIHADCQIALPAILKDPPPPYQQHLLLETTVLLI